MIRGGRLQGITIASIELPTADKPVKVGLRLSYLDGLRALASVYVVLFHAGVGFTSNQLPFFARGLRHCLTFGHHAVAVFIVLSGYCLMLPVARSNGHLVGGAPKYFMRRAWRILPPYYAALLGTLLLMWAAPLLSTPTGTIWDDSLPAFEPGPIATHLLLIHNWFPSWIYRINGPLWSVATEWQIYFFFPLVLLPIWRRAGVVATALTAFAIGCAPLWLVPRVAAHSIPWYLGLFALGMSGAAVGFSPRAFEQRLLRGVPWKALCLVLSGCCLLGSTVFVGAWFRLMPLSDALVGATTTALLVHYSRLALSSSARKPMLLRLLESRLLVGIGHFSYSLYLSHLPIVALCYFLLRPLSLPPQLQMGAMIALGTPASLAAAYAFFRVVETHFLVPPLALSKK